MAPAASWLAWAVRRLECRWSALRWSQSPLLGRANPKGPAMKPLNLPVPGTVTARYLIPLHTAMTGAQARQRTIEAIEAQLTGMRRARIHDWVQKGAVTIDVTALPDGTRPLPEPVGTVRAIVRVCATGP